MASRSAFHTQLSSIMETMARSVLSQVCKLVDEDSMELRMELSRLLIANSTLAERVCCLEGELTAVRGDAPKLSKSYRSVGVQAAHSNDTDGHVTGPPTIEGIFGKEWCMNLWKDRNPYSFERLTDSPHASEKSVGTLCDQITVTEIKENDFLVDTASDQHETLGTEVNEASMGEEREQLSIGFTVEGTTCSLSFDQDAEEVCAGGIEDPSMQLIAMTDTEGTFSSHIIPIEDEEEGEEEEDDDDVQFVQESQQESNISEDGSALDQDSVNDSNVSNIESGRDPSRDKFTCQICSRTFFHKGTLTHHMKSHKLNFCNICKQHFPHRNKLKSHTCVPSLPAQRITKACELCGKTFANPSALRIHYVVHTGEKPYRCSLCGKGFTQKGNLKCHLRIHTGEKPFCCVRCGKTFTQKVNLNHHLMAHRNREVVEEKPILFNTPL